MIVAALIIIAGMAVTIVNGVLVDAPFVVQLTNVGSVAAFAFVGVVVLWQRPGHGIGRLALAIALMFALSTLLETGLEIANPRWGFARVIRAVAEIVSTMLSNLATVGGGLILVVWFPDGRRTSRLGLVVEVLVVLIVVATVVTSVGEDVAKRLALPDVVFEIIEAMQAAFALIIVAVVLATLDLMIRYRTADPVRRTQIRWVLAGSMGTIVSFVVVAVAGEAIPGLWSILGLSTTLPAIAIAIAISRYRLYDIDRIVSRTIAYSLVTAVLFAAFLVINLVLQGFLSSATAADPLAVALSTLVVAASFQPVRHRVQAIVDRRFHRARYDGERTAAAFSVRMRDATDLPTVAADLDTTVRRALAPSGLGLWLRGVER